MTRKLRVPSAAARPVAITRSLLRTWPLPKLDATLGKEARGRVLVVGGSAQIPGAVMLAAIGALRAGAGKLQIATAARVAPAVAIAIPEARVIGLREAESGELEEKSCRAIHEEARNCNALLLGPGMEDARAAIQLFTHCLAGRSSATLIVDAAALEAFAKRKRPGQVYAGGVIATPHAGEMASLWGIERDEVLARPLEVAREAAAHLNVVMVLKGAETFVVAPDGRAYRNRAGNLGLGTSGSGDTLSGIIAGLCARGADPLKAAVWGVHLHALAGERLAVKLGPLGFLARELLSEIPSLLSELSP